MYHIISQKMFTCSLYISGKVWGKWKRFFKNAKDFTKKKKYNYKKGKQQKHSNKNAMHYVAIHLIFAGSVVYWGSALAGAVEVVVKLCTHGASFEGEKLVENLAKQA